MRLRGATAGAAAAASSSSSSSSRGGAVSPVPPRSVCHQRRRVRSALPLRWPACPPPASALSSLAELAALSAGAEEQLQAALNAMAAAALEAEAAAVDPSLAAGDGRAALSAVSQAALDAGAAASGALPAAVDGLLGPLLRFFAADVAGTFSFPPRPESALRIGLLSYLLFAQPSPLRGILDFYLAAPLAALTTKRWSEGELTLRDRMGGGNYGQVFEGMRVGASGAESDGEGGGAGGGGAASASRRGSGSGASTSSSRLTEAQKRRRVVLKRVNADGAGGARAGFLNSGTIARGAAESGLAEAYFCARVSRDPLASRVAASYLGQFVPSSSGRGFTPGSQWLVWRFESDSTLGDALSGLLGPFPGCLAGIMLGEGAAARLEARDDARGGSRNRGRSSSISSSSSRSGGSSSGSSGGGGDGGLDYSLVDAAVVRDVARKLLKAVRALHSLGLVHRDVKPENVLLTVKGEVKLIDFGAAADMCTGINFSPLSGMLDPRYSPPEELVLPKTFPRAPVPLLAALAAPLVWAYGRPDLFDAYSAGALFVQMAVPDLRSPSAQRSFNGELARSGGDLDAWRRSVTSRGGRLGYDFSLLDADGGAGWDLARGLLAPRSGPLNRGRLSCSAALRHRYFRNG